MADANPIDDKALDSLSVAPAAPTGQGDDGTARSDAGQDTDITDRLKRNPESKEARLDTALDESMDASDPPASTQPIHHHEAPASSGYDADAEAKRRT